jgi:hypothetical protein
MKEFDAKKRYFGDRTTVEKICKKMPYVEISSIVKAS